MEVNTTPDDSRHHFSHSHPYHHHHHHHGSLPSNSIIIIIIAIIVMVIIAITLIILLLRRLKSGDNSDDVEDEKGSLNNSFRFIAQNSMNFNSSPDVKGGCLQGGNLGRSMRTSVAITTPTRYREAVQVLSYKELEEATDKFSEANVLGRGRFGVVYRGVLRDGTAAAIKMLHREGRQGERAFRLEVDLLSRLHSPYLVELLGYCADQHHRLLVYECMPNGTLQHHLHSRNHQQQQPLDWDTRLRIALDCAKALEFLHEQNIPSVIHRDFKCTNVLLDENFRAKVSDFGLAKMASDKINGQDSTRVLGSTGYLAPE